MFDITNTKVYACQYISWDMTFKLLDISYFLNDYAEKIMPQNIIYIVSTFANRNMLLC